LVLLPPPPVHRAGRRLDLPPCAADILYRAVTAAAFLALHRGAGIAAPVFDLLPGVSISFLPVGVSLAFAIVHGWRSAPLIALALLAGSGISWEAAAHAVRHAMVYAGLGVLCRGMPEALAGTAGVLRFCALAGAGTALSAGLAAAVFALAGNPAATSVQALLGFWMGDLSGALLMTGPAVVVLRGLDRALRGMAPPPVGPGGLLRSLATIGALALLSASAVLLIPAMPVSGTMAWVLPVVPIAAAALFHGAVAAAWVSVAANCATGLAAGPEGAGFDLVDVQAFLLLACLGGALLGSMAEERRRSERRLLEMAHELGNLLHPIGNLSMQAERVMAEDAEAAKAYLRVVRDCASHGGEIVRGALGAARPGPAEGRRSGLAGAVRSAAAVVAGQVPPGIRIELDASGEDPPIRLAPGEAHGIVANLMLNAAHAMSGRGTMRLRTGRLDLVEGAACVPALAPGRYAFLSVADDGCGMDERTRARMFEPFFTTRRPGEGNGLGLSIVYGIVEGAGGGLLVRSMPGRGSDITVLLPVEET
jgi:signal transduction histidine kinase